MNTYRVYADVVFSCVFDIEAENEQEARELAHLQADNDPIHHARLGFYTGANVFEMSQL